MSWNTSAAVGERGWEVNIQGQSGRKDKIMKQQHGHIINVHVAITLHYDNEDLFDPTLPKHTQSVHSNPIFSLFGGR